MTRPDNEFVWKECQSLHSSWVLLIFCTYIINRRALDSHSSKILVNKWLVKLSYGQLLVKTPPMTYLIKQRTREYWPIPWLNFPASFEAKKSGQIWIKDRFDLKTKSFEIRKRLPYKSFSYVYGQLSSHLKVKTTVFLVYYDLYGSRPRPGTKIA